jgi:hypothetical protein
MIPSFGNESKLSLRENFLPMAKFMPKSNLDSNSK